MIEFIVRPLISRNVYVARLIAKLFCTDQLFLAVMMLGKKFIDKFSCKDREQFYEALFVANQGNRF